MSQTLELTRDLLARRSVTPADEGCQALMAQRLGACGFAIENLRYGSVENLWARRGTGGPVFCFAGHTDVVPTGPLEDWTSDPFVPVVSNLREHPTMAGRVSVPLDPAGVASYDAVLIVTDHDSIDYVSLAKSARLIIDTRNACARTGAVGEHIVKA